MGRFCTVSLVVACHQSSGETGDWGGVGLSSSWVANAVVPTANPAMPNKPPMLPPPDPMPPPPPPTPKLLAGWEPLGALKELELPAAWETLAWAELELEFELLSPPP